MNNRPPKQPDPGLKGRKDKAQGVSPGISRMRSSGLKGRQGLWAGTRRLGVGGVGSCRPCRAPCVVAQSQACGLGSDLSPLQGSQRGATEQGHRTALFLSSVFCLLFSGLLPAAAAEDLAPRLHRERSSYATGSLAKYRPMERPWLPAVADSLTLGLFPFDPVDAAKEVEAILDDAGGGALDDKTAPAAEDTAGVAKPGKDSGLPLKNSSKFSLRQPAYARGACEIVTDGRNGGALKLAGPESVIRLPDCSYGTALTLEAWFAPDKLGGTLFFLPSLRHGVTAFAVTLTPEGQLALTVNGKAVQTGTRKLAAGAFTHVALVFRDWVDKDGVFPRDLLLFVNGHPELHYAATDYRENFKRITQPLLVGNAAGGTAPFSGRVDDLRVSRTGRDYYPINDSACDPQAARPLARDWPCLRGPAELRLEAPLDGTFTPATGNLAAAPLPAAWTGEFAPAMRGQGLIVSEKQGARFAPPEPQPVTQGSLEFWYMPHNWDNRRTYSIDDTSGNFVTPVCRLLVTTGVDSKPQPLITFRIDQTSETKGVLKEYFLYTQQPGTWHHAVLNWQGQELRLFIDGVEYTDLAGNHPVFLATLDRRLQPNQCRFAALEFGGFGGGMTVGSTVIDEVRLYTHRLTRPEIRNAYQRFLSAGTVQPLPPVDLSVTMNHPLHQLKAAIELLLPERQRITTCDLEIAKADVGGAWESVERKPGLTLEDGSRFVELTNPAITYGDYQFRFAFKDAAGLAVRSVDVPHRYPQPAWVNNTLGVHDGEVMPPWTPMTWRDGVVGCWGREMTIGPSGWPVKIVSQGQAIMPAAPEFRLVTDKGEVRLEPAAVPATVEKQQPDVTITKGVAQGGGWTLTTTVRTEFDGLLKLDTRLAGPEDAEVRELRIAFPLQFAPQQLIGFYTGEHWFRASHDFRLLPAGEGVVFSSNKTGRQHPKDWTGKVSFLPYVTLGDDSRSFIWFSENDRNWTQQWDPASITVSRGHGLTTLNLNIITAPTRVTEPLVYTFGLQATPIRPLAPDTRSTLRSFNFGQVCGFNGFYLQADFEGHMAFRLAPKNLDWSHPEREAARYRSSHRGAPMLMYIDRTWSRAPDDALEYNRDWRGWGDAVRYTKPVRDAYAYYMNEWLRRGLCDGIYIDDGWIDPTKSLWHLDPADNLSYRRAGGKAEDFSDREWGFEFFDYRDMLKRIRWLFLDNKVKPRIVVHGTQTPYYPVFSFIDILLEGEDRYLSREGEDRDFITSWGIPRLRYASPQKWGVPVLWLPILSDGKKLESRGLPMHRWYFQQRRAHVAGLLLHDVMPAGAGGPFAKELAAAGLCSDQAAFLGYWEAAVPVTAADPEVYASVYRLPDRLGLVFVNAGKGEKVCTFKLDPAKVKALLGTDAFRLQDADSATIPAIDQEYAELRSGGVKMKALEAGVTGTKDGDAKLDAQAGGLLQEMDAEEKKANDPDAFFEYHNFRYENDTLRLRIQRNDYRLLQLLPGK